MNSLPAVKCFFPVLDTLTPIYNDIGYYSPEINLTHLVKFIYSRRIPMRVNIHLTYYTPRLISNNWDTAHGCLICEYIRIVDGEVRLYGRMFDTDISKIQITAVCGPVNFKHNICPSNNPTVNLFLYGTEHPGHSTYGCEIYFMENCAPGQVKVPLSEWTVCSNPLNNGLPLIHTLINPEYTQEFYERHYPDILPESNESQIINCYTINKVNDEVDNYELYCFHNMETSIMNETVRKGRGFFRRLIRKLQQ